MAKRQHIILHKRRRHAGTLAFFTLVPVADLAGAVLTFLYGASVGAWLLTVAKWLLVSTGDFLQHGVLTILVLIFILFFLGIAVGVKEAQSKAIAVGLTLLITAIWGILRLGFMLQWTHHCSLHSPTSTSSRSTSLASSHFLHSLIGRPAWCGSEFTHSCIWSRRKTSSTHRW